jgi:hypothetical protein
MIKSAATSLPRKAEYSRGGRQEKELTGAL